MDNGTREAIVGKCKLHATQNGAKHTVEFNVLQGKYTPILNLESCVALGFLKIFDCDQPERIPPWNLLLCLQRNRCSSSFKMCLLVLENWKPLQNRSRSQCTASCTPSKKDTGSHSQRIEGKAWWDGCRWCHCTCHWSHRLGFEYGGSPQTLWSPLHLHRP